MPQANLNSLRNARINQFARMLPLYKWQRQVYHMADAHPPGMPGYQPRWEVVNAVLAAQKSMQAKIEIVEDFHLLAILASATANTVGGFRVQLYDALKKVSLQERGVQFPLLGGGASGAQFLREPYRFDLKHSQLNVMLQNMEPGANTVQLALYGVAAPFEGALR